MKVGIFDIETTSLNAEFGIVLCVVHQRYDDDQPHIIRIDQGGNAQWLPRSDDKDVVAQTIRVLCEYDVLVAHNGVRFDKAFLNSRALFWGLTQLLVPDTKFIDPCLVARRALRFSGNSLERLASALDVGIGKSPVDGRTWVKAGMDRDPTAMDEVVKHCVQDVRVLAAVYERLLPFVRQINPWGSA